jgi:hypothetical protein
MSEISHKPKLVKIFKVWNFTKLENINVDYWYQPRPIIMKTHNSTFVNIFVRDCDYGISLIESRSIRLKWQTKISNSIPINNIFKIVPRSSADSIRLKFDPIKN